MKSPCPMNQFRIITSSVFTLQFREMKSLRIKTKSAVNHIIHINHIKPQAKTAQTLHIAQSEPSPHHLSDRCLSPAHAWSPASRSRWDLVHPWRRSSGWWGRSRCPCWNLGSPMPSTWLRHGFDTSQSQSHDHTIETTVALTPVVETPLIWRAFSPHSERLKMRPATSHLVSLSFDLISDVVEVREFLVTNLHKGDFGDPSCNIPNTVTLAVPLFGACRLWCIWCIDLAPCQTRPTPHFQRTPPIAAGWGLQMLQWIEQYKCTIITLQS